MMLAPGNQDGDLLLCAPIYAHHAIRLPGPTLNLLVRDLRAFVIPEDLVPKVFRQSSALWGWALLLPFIRVGLVFFPLWRFRGFVFPLQRKIGRDIATKLIRRMSKRF